MEEEGGERGRGERVKLLGHGDGYLVDMRDPGLRSLRPSGNVWCGCGRPIAFLL